MKNTRNILSIVALAFAGFILFAPTSHAAITDSLVEFWRLDEASGTRYGNANQKNLTDNNTVGGTTGKLLNAANFVRANSEYLSSTDTSFQITGDFTVSMWVKFNTLTNYNVFVSKNSGSEFWAYTQANGGGDFQIGGGSVGTQAFPASTFTTGAWYHIVLWWDKTNNQMGYAINNGSAVTAATSGSPATSTSAFILGSSNGTHYVDADIDGVGFWNRVLTSGERTTLYNSGNAYDYPFTDLGQKAIFHYDLDETSGTRADSLFSHPLTDNNTVLYGAGKISNAADFEDTNSEYLTASSDTLLQTGDINFTAACWVNPESFSGFDWVMGKGYWEWAFITNNGTPRFYVNTNGSAYAEWTSAMSTGSWYYFVGYHDTTNNLLGISVNGGNFATSSYTSGISTNTDSLGIGASYAAGFPFDGLIDECTFWKGRILTQGEVSTLYNSGSGLTYPFSTSTPPTGSTILRRIFPGRIR